MGIPGIAIEATSGARPRSQAIMTFRRGRRSARPERATPPSARGDQTRHIGNRRQQWRSRPVEYEQRQRHPRQLVAGDRQDLGEPQGTELPHREDLAKGRLRGCRGRSGYTRRIGLAASWLRG